MQRPRSPYRLQLLEVMTEATDGQRDQGLMIGRINAALREWGNNGVVTGLVRTLCSRGNRPMWLE